MLKTFRVRRNLYIMPKATRASARRSTKNDPIKTTHPDSTRSKNPKDSHLYTDDNPATTLQGTGFSSADKAHHTISIISRRSATYQFQTVNTMYHRAKHHPHPSDGMRDAMDVFKLWIDETYPVLKSDQDKWKKGMVGRPNLKLLVPVLRKLLGDAGETEELRYLGAAMEAINTGKRLANVLVNDKEPGGLDWERARQQRLDELVGERQDWTAAELWRSEAGTIESLPTIEHARILAWAWTPETAAALTKRLKRLPQEYRQIDEE